MAQKKPLAEGQTRKQQSQAVNICDAPLLNMLEGGQNAQEAEEARWEQKKTAKKLRRSNPHQKYGKHTEFVE